MPLKGTLAAGSALGFGAGSGVAPTCFICATGGTITNCGDYRTHTFTGDDSFVMNAPVKTACNAKVDYIVVAGGGGSGGSNYGGGGGGGGFRESKGATFPGTGSPLATSTQLCLQEGGSFPITVGAGGGFGDAGCCVNRGLQGNPSVFSNITSAGGGGGGAWPGTTPAKGLGGDGGSGGGGASSPTENLAGGSGNSPPVSPPQGQNGSISTSNIGSTGGGGAGGGATTAVSGDRAGGDGAVSDVASPAIGESNPTGQAFGGGGGAATSNPTATLYPGGLGGGGNGGFGCKPHGETGPTCLGLPNTGGGGGAGPLSNQGGTFNGTGGSGAVQIRYKFQ